MDKQQETTFTKEDNLNAPLCSESVTQNEPQHYTIAEANSKRVFFCTRRAPVSRDSKWAWIVVIAASLVQFIVMGVHNSFGVIYQEIRQEFNWTESTSAFIGSAAVGLNFLICPIGTQLCESFSPQMVTVIGGAISVAGLLGTSVVSTEYATVLSYSVVWGIGSSLCYSSTYVIVGEMFHKHMALAMGIITAGSGIGQLTMAPSIEGMLSSFGWKTTMRILGFLASILILAALTYRETTAQQERTHVRRSWRQLFDCSLWCIPGFAILTISLAIFNFGYYIPIIHVPFYCETKGFSEKKASWLISFMAVPSTISRLVFGILADHPRVNRLLLMFQVCLSMMAVSTILCPFVSDEYAGFALYMIIFGTGDGCLVGTAPTITAQIVGRKKLSPAIGLLFFTFAGPLMAGPSIAGRLYKETNRYKEAFFVAGGTMGLCVVLLSFIHLLSKPSSSEYIMDNHDARTTGNDTDFPRFKREGLAKIPNGTSRSSEELPLSVVYTSSV